MSPRTCNLARLVGCELNLTTLANDNLRGLGARLQRAPVFAFRVEDRKARVDLAGGLILAAVDDELRAHGRRRGRPVRRYMRRL